MAKKARRKAAKVAKARRGPGRPPGSNSRSAALSGLQSYHGSLMAERDRIDKEIMAIEDAMGVMQGSGITRRAAGGPGRRAGGGGAGGGGGMRSGSLKEFIYNVLSSRGEPMAVKDITQAVLDSGYQTRNKTLAKSVGIALAEMPEAQKVGRGLFKAK